MSRNAVANCLRKSIKHGVGHLTASADASSLHSTKPIFTRLTVSHKSPIRLLPLNKTSIRKAGAAICALSNYGAGMLQGDSSEIFVHVEDGAKLGLITQGPSRVYSQRVPTVCEARMHAKIEKDGFFAFAPDPCTLFASSSYSQTQVFDIHPQSSIAVIDWFSSGRFENNERWQFDILKTSTKFNWLHDDNVPFISDSTTIDFCGMEQGKNDDTHALGDFNCFASLILYGERVQSVKDRCQSLADTLVSKYTRTRDRRQCESSDRIDAGTTDSLAGRVIMGCSRVILPGKPSDAYVVRVAGKTNSDIYRIWHQCLMPIKTSFGLEFYRDRVLAKRSEIPKKKRSCEPIKMDPKDNDKIKTSLSRKRARNPNSADSLSNKETTTSLWSVMMLADSAFPTGSFAHSGGLEAAAQLGMIKNERDLLNYVQATVRSSIQLLVPFLISTFRIIQSGETNNVGKKVINVRGRFDKLNRQCNAVMVSNEPAWSASIDQGKSLARVASLWLVDQESMQDILDCLKKESSPHIATTLGLIGGLLDLDEIQLCRVYSYCMTRDIVSAAVRLSLVGPLASVKLLHNVRDSAEDYILTAHTAMIPNDPLSVAATSAPVIEAIHPCHQNLNVRLFRS